MHINAGTVEGAEGHRKWMFSIPGKPKHTDDGYGFWGSCEAPATYEFLRLAKSHGALSYWL